MPAPFPPQLRLRILAALRAGERPTHIARRFHVSDRYVFRLKRRLKQDLPTDPRPHAGGRAPHLTDEDTPFFLALLAEDVSMTHATMAQRFTDATGRIVTRQTVQCYLKRWALTRKKNDGKPPSETAKTSRASA